MEENIEELSDLCRKGKFREVIKKLNIEECPSFDKCRLRIYIYLYENNPKGALDFCERYNYYISAGIKGLVSLSNKQFKDAITYFENEIKNVNRQGHFLYIFECYLLLIDSYLFNDEDNTNRISELIKSLKYEYHPFIGNRSTPFFSRMQFYLIGYFLDKQKGEKVDNYDLVRYFNESGTVIVKVFDDIIKYSSCLNYQPSDLIEPFMKSRMVFEDKYFKHLTEKLDENSVNSLKRIWFWEKLILAQLYINEDSEIGEICHYTSKSAFDEMIKSEPSPMREVSLAGTNDKIEGNVLPKILYKNGLRPDVNCDNDNNYIAAQTSFSRTKNSLTMFRLYGKAEDKEGTGVSLVFGRNYFLTDFSLIAPDNLNNENKDENTDTNDMNAKEKEDPRQPIAWVLYYDDEKNLLYFYPYKDDLEPAKIFLDSKNTKWNSFKNDLNKQKVNNLEYSFKNLLKEIRGLNKDLQEIAVKILYKLRYFIKRSDFAEEKELRIIELVKPNDSEIEDGGNFLYKNYLDIWQYDSLKEIIFGPKAINKAELECYKRKVWEKDSDISIKISDAPLA